MMVRHYLVVWTMLGASPMPLPCSSGQSAVGVGGGVEEVLLACAAHVVLSHS